MNILGLSLATAVAIGCGVHAQTTWANDAEFVTKAAQGGMMEVELGHVASNQGQSDAVKNFGQRMVTDHGKANDALKTAATTDGLSVPSSMSDKQNKDMEKLKEKHGAGFDKAYTKSMIKDHKEDIALFEKEAKSGTSPAVKAFANDTLPTLREHLKMAEQMK